jgi:hypothetical protein
MGFFDKILGKNETGIIADISNIKIDEALIALGFLRERNKYHSIILNSDKYTTINAGSPALYEGMVNIMSDKLNMKEYYKKTDFLQGINIFDTSNFLNLKKMGKFDWVKKPFLFTDNTAEAKKILDWSILRDINPHKNMVNLVGYEKAYSDLENGGSKHPESLHYAYANYHMQIESLDQSIFGGGKKKEYSYGDIAYSLYLIESWIDQK